MLPARSCLIALAGLSLSACLPAMVATRAAGAIAESARGKRAAAEVPIHHYVRSNRDGSEPENVVHFRPTPTGVSVYKWMSKCETAAYVTADMAPDSWEARSLDAGKVGRKGEQVRFGRIDADLRTRELVATATIGGQSIRDTARMPAGRPWFLFDYDLADLNVFLQETRPTDDFRFAFALLMPGIEDGPLAYLASLDAEYLGQVIEGGRALRRFHVTSSGGQAMSGDLWLDPATSAIVEASFDRPNHDFLKDFRLKLVRVDRGGEAAWDAMMKAHYAGCPA